MPTEFITKVATELEQAGFQVRIDPLLAGIPALLYACASKRIRLGFAKVEEHFLFLGWESAAFGRLDTALEYYERFRPLANQGFKTPHSLRLTIPSMALVLVSSVSFPAEVQQYARTKSLAPFKGGEVGQLVLVDLTARKVTHWVETSTGRYPSPGALPLGHAAEVLDRIFARVFIS